MKKKLILLLLVVSFGALSILVFAANKEKEVQKYFSFKEENALKDWQEKIFKGKTLYVIDRVDNEAFVDAKSQGAASGYFYKVSYSCKDYPMMSWKWRLEKFPDKGGPEGAFTAEKDDFAARIYVIFPSGSFLTSKCIEYIWDEFAPAGSIIDSPYSKNIKLWVLESGKKKLNKWIFEERNIYEDYKTAFGYYPKLKVGAIAFMTDSDSASTSAEASYDEIKVGYIK